MVVPKLKAELEASANTLNATLETADTCREEMQKNDQLAKEEQKALKATLTKLMAERDQLVKEKFDVEVKEKSLTIEVGNCQEFILVLMRKAFIRVCGKHLFSMVYRLWTHGTTWEKMW